jgi:2-succinyl-5-enolpyruvyl-6-hydroxy-3-cyclohexene-1-carboxylate synthase
VNPSTALATALVDQLVRSGVTDVVVCPGSRSAPLAYAVQQAERASRLRMHVRVDERSAGFLALGLGKLTRVPAAVVTTSGTAVANLHPAVLEAHHGVVPLVVLSADRPAELRGTGANQTTEAQPSMFGAAVRWGLDLAAPAAHTVDDACRELADWRAAARTAFERAIGEAGAEAGPVHLNVQLREPLVPTSEPVWPGGLPGSGSHQPGPGHADPTGAGPHRPGQGVDPTPPRTLVVVGDLPDPSDFPRALRWARSHGWPVVAEPFGTWPREGVLPHGPLLLTVSAWVDAHAPERVVTVGRTTLSRPVAALLRRPGTVVEAVRTHGWVRSATGAVRTHDRAVLDLLGDSPGDTAWASAWRDAGDRLARAVAGAPTDWPSGRAVATVSLREIPAGATLFVGSSNSVRDVDLAASERAGDLLVTASRGLAGIDGCVSTAVGIALAGDRPAYALMGDLTFLHDANGLAIGPHEPRPDLTIVVVNDDGGGIFTVLEPGEPDRAADFERLFGTPTGTDLAELCAAHGVRHERVTSAAALAAAVRRPPAGLTVVEVVVDRRSHRSAGEALRELAAQAVRGH